MDQMMGGEGGIGGQAGFPLETWFWEMPLCTRWWTTATVLTSVLVQCQIVTPFQLFYSFRAVFVKSQVCQVQLSLPTWEYQQLTMHSTGASSQPSSTSVPSRWIWSSTSSSSSGIHDYWRNHPVGHRRTSLGCYSMQRPV